MYDIIKKYVENENSTGLMLVDMPTGSGKTYSSIQFIYNSCMNADNANRKYIFVTTLKKNLPTEDLKAWFEKDGKLEQYNEKVLVLDSNMDSVVDRWTNEIDSNIPIELKKTEEYRRFKSDLTFVKNQRSDKKYELIDMLSSVEANLREKTEPKFRRLVSEYLNKEYKTVEEKIMAIKTNKRWQWLGKLYPAVFTKERQVLFMSMDKFLSRNTTIVEPSYVFYNSDIIKEAVIFIDEFDATKETMLQNIINNGLRDKINYVELFKDIYSALHTDDFPIELTTPSKLRQEGHYKNQSLDSVIKGIKDKADEIFNTYSLQFKHRTDGDIDDNVQNYMFQDHQFHSILSDKDKRFITMNSDVKRKINRISFEKNKPTLEKNNIQSMLGQLRGFIKYFQGAINILAINYMQRKNEIPNQGDTFTMEYAIKSILNLFGLSKDNVDYLAIQIMATPRKVKDGIEQSAYDLTLYENGFRYYSFENNTEHDMQSQIMMYSFQTTPEKLLLRFCEKAKVIGISATATVPSVIGNFDITYLQDKLQHLFVKLTDEERKRLSDEFKKSQQGYKDISLKAELLGEQGKYSKSAWSEVFSNNELAEYVYDILQRSFGENEDSNNYCKERYLRIAFAFKKFVTDKDIRSFLCVLTKHPKKDDKYLDRNKLHEIFKYIALDNGWNNYNERSIVYLDGAEYDDKKNNLIQRLAEGQKLFVISVYQTIGAGQNLQYPVPEAFKNSVVRINERSRRNEKDFDAIYLDKPTNLIVQLGDNLLETDFTKYLFQMEFLQESGELSTEETIRNIKRAFKIFMTGHKNMDAYADVYGKKSHVLLCTRYIIQAIGRICRTNQKNKTVYVYADNRIAENIDTSVVEGRVFNYEFMALVDAVKKYGEKNPEVASLENRAILSSGKVNKHIRNFLSDNWDNGKIKQWHELRELVLTCPTASKEDASNNFVIKNFYVELPEKNNYLFYRQEEDYNNVSVSFVKNKEHQKCLSMEESKLEIMMKIPGVKEFFIEKGWATEYRPNDFIMTPPLWNNIYKGALGEVVGCFLFEKVLKIKLEEITDPELFELFDYIIPQTSIYLDFKNWHEGYTEDNNGMLSKISEKAKKCNCKCVIVANIITENEWNISEVDYEGVHILSIPYLVKMQNENLYYDRVAWDAVRRCVDEYKDKN